MFYFYFSGLSLRREPLKYYLHTLSNETMFSIWKWIHKYNPQKVSLMIKKVFEYIIDETVIKIDSELFWLCVGIENKIKRILGLNIQREKHVCCSRTIYYWFAKIHGKHQVVTTDGNGTWYPSQA